MDLSTRKCKPCEGGVAPLNQQEVAGYKERISDDWEVAENKRISKEFLFDNFKHAMEFVNKVADLAEEEGHHPVMHVSYGKVIIELSTDAINGLSENDFIVASKIDEL